MFNIFRKWFEKTKQTRATESAIRLQIERLEDRLMPAALAAAPIIGPLPVIVDYYDKIPVPVLNSNLGAPTTIYLDFNGNCESDWFFQDSEGGPQTHFKNVITPAFDTDGDRTRFSAAELESINQIFRTVEEDYAPFNVNVTTDYHGSFGNLQALHVVIGGSCNDWLHIDASGMSSIGSFDDGAPNVVFVFSKDIKDWADLGYVDDHDRALQLVPSVGATISHEAGHSFGLFHHSTFNANGTINQEYDPDTDRRTGIMGANLEQDRVTWSNTLNDQHVLQDDVSMIALMTGLGRMRPDDHGNDIAHATNLSPGTDNNLVALGIIETLADKDCFTFTTAAGTITAEVQTCHFNGNLDARLELWRVDRQAAVISTPFQSIQLTRIDAQDRADMLGATITADLPAGSYALVVCSHNTYGDLGQYRVVVAGATTPLTIAKPTKPALLSAPSTWFDLGMQTMLTSRSMSSVNTMAYPVAMPNAGILPRAITSHAITPAGSGSGTHANLFGDVDKLLSNVDVLEAVFGKGRI